MNRSRVERGAFYGYLTLSASSTKRRRVCSRKVEAGERAVIQALGIDALKRGSSEAKERNGIRRMTRPRVERGYAADEENDRNIFDPGVKKQRTIETNSAYQPTTRPRVERAYSTSPLKNGLTWRRRATQNQVLTRVAGAGMRKSLVGGVGRRAKGIRGKRITRRSTLKSWIRIERWGKGDQKKNASQRHRTGSRVEREYSADDTENMGTERWSSSSGLMGSPWLRNARGILRAQREPRAV
ncbi:hypothetical protein B0H11DRAFT_1915467 [Mycena galericulata]|nr:hypothetical protein B0H11DRAFT_1915467 [Mycena galericulata]